MKTELEILRGRVELLRCALDDVAHGFGNIEDAKAHAAEALKDDALDMAAARGAAENDVWTMCFVAAITSGTEPKHARWTADEALAVWCEVMAEVPNAD